MAARKDREVAVVRQPGSSVPAILKDAGPRATKRFLEFFAANIRNRNTREAYYRALVDFFAWCDDRGFGLLDIEPIVVAAYVEYLGGIYSKPTIKQHLAAIRMCFDWLVVGQILPMSPASSVRGPTYVVKRGKTPVLSADEARQLLDSIETDTIAGLRDRALIGVMVYSFARVSAVVGMQVDDFYQSDKRFLLRLHEKGGRFHEVHAHHNAVAYLDAYLAEAPRGDGKSTLFRTLTPARVLTERPMSRVDALRMIKRRAMAIGLSRRICCHTFRATGITAYLQNGGHSGRHL